MVVDVAEGGVDVVGDTRITDLVVGDPVVEDSAALNALSEN
jgi:hypothetical protein